jgi:cell division protease FtsH
MARLSREEIPHLVCHASGFHMELKGLRMSRTLKTVVFWAVIVVAAFLLWQIIRAGPESNLHEISYSEFLSRVESESVVKVRISPSEIIGDSRDGSHFRLVPPTSQDTMLRLLHDKNVEIWFRDAGSANWQLQLLGTWAPLILLAALWFFMIRQMQRSRSRIDSKP